MNKLLEIHTLIYRPYKNRKNYFGHTMTLRTLTSSEHLADGIFQLPPGFYPFYEFDDFEESDFIQTHYRIDNHEEFENWFIMQELAMSDDPFFKAMKFYEIYP